MLYLRADLVLALVTTMSEQLLQQEDLLDRADLIMGLAIAECEMLELANAHMSERIGELVEQVENQRLTIRGMCDKCDRFEELDAQAAKLQEQVRQLMSTNHKLRLGLKPETSAEDAANSYMLRFGVDEWAKVGCSMADTDAYRGKIGTIKLIRELTMWGLKETKDFCEAYIARIEQAKAERSDSGPGTLRSSQIPAGVGVMSERPILVANV